MNVGFIIFYNFYTNKKGCIRRFAGLTKKKST